VDGGEDCEIVKREGIECAPEKSKKGAVKARATGGGTQDGSNSTKRRPTRSAPGKDIRVPLSAEATLANIKADLKAWELKQVIKRGKKGKK